LLRKVLGKAKLPFIQLQRVIKRIRTAINSRPITFVAEDPNEPLPICPNDLIIGRVPREMPPTYDDEDLVNASQRDVIAMAKLRQKLSDDFWDLWQRHYLQERAIHWEWRHRATPIRVGEVVLVREDNV
jgi:hypothetical protein